MAIKFQHLRKVIRLSHTQWRLLPRYALIAAILGGVSYLFAFTGGWVTWPAHASRLSPKQIINAFEANTGAHPGFRRNHAKGICVTGRFESNGNATALSRASVFKAGVVPVTGRLSMPGSDPTQADGTVPVRSFALRFTLRDGEEWRTAMNSVPLFMVRTPQDLYAELVAMHPDKTTGKTDPARLSAFLQKHPEMEAFHAWTESHPASSGFDNSPYFSVNAFHFIDSNGKVRDVKWSVVPETPYKPVQTNERDDPDFLGHELVKRLAHAPVRWHLVISLALPGDATDDVTRPWADTPDRVHVDAGTLVIDRAESQVDGPCRDINFDPLILPAGIQPTNDPMLAARSAAYAVSFDRRVREEAHSESKR